MSKSDNKKFNDVKLGYIRWYPNRGLPKIRAEVFSPFTYKEDILERLRWMHPTEVIEFLDAGQNVVMTATVKMVREVIGHVTTVTDKLVDSATVDKEDYSKLRYASPWAFWKSKEIQDIVKRYL
jgi:hypothetical protein